MGASERDIGDDGGGGAKWPLMTGVRVFHVHCTCNVRGEAQLKDKEYL